jgi:hypothetical protein
MTPNKSNLTNNQAAAPPNIQPVSGGGAMHSRKVFKRLGLGVMMIFALEGFFFTAVFVVMQFGLLNVRGSIDSRNKFFSTLPKSEVNAATIPKKRQQQAASSRGLMARPYLFVHGTKAKNGLQCAPGCKKTRR